jgi:hypothetical protein
MKLQFRRWTGRKALKESLRIVIEITMSARLAGMNFKFVQRGDLQCGFLEPSFFYRV